MGAWGLIGRPNASKSLSMMSPRALVCLMPLALAACNIRSDDNATAPAGDATARPSQEDQQLIATGVTPEAIAAARAYLAPFITADPASCFGDVELGTANMRAAEAMPLAIAPGTTRVVIAVDGSGSMAARIGGRSKLDLAKESTLAFIDGLSPDVDASLLVFGQQGNNADSGKAKSCTGIDQLAPMSRDRAALAGAVRQVRAVGWTPLAAALQRAQAQLSATAQPSEQVIYVVSDGNETCGGDPVAVARAINTGQKRAIVNIIGFDLPRADAAALEAVASAGGGKLVNISDDAAYQRTMAVFRDMGRRSRNATHAIGARTRNIVNSDAAVTKATTCTSAILTREGTQVFADLTRREVAGETTPDRRAVLALLDRRHKDINARLDAVQARLKTNSDAANDAISAQEKAAD